MAFRVLPLRPELGVIEIPSPDILPDEYMRCAFAIVTARGQVPYCTYQMMSTVSDPVDIQKVLSANTTEEGEEEAKEDDTVAATQAGAAASEATEEAPDETEGKPRTVLDFDPALYSMATTCHVFADFGLPPEVRRGIEIAIDKGVEVVGHFLLPALLRHDPLHQQLAACGVKHTIYHTSL